MKTGLVGFLLVAVLLACGLLFASRMRTAAPVADAHAVPAATAPAAAPSAPVELARGEDPAVRIATAPPPAPEPEPEPKAPELQGPPREEQRVADVSQLRDLTQPPPQIVSVDGHRAQFADLDLKYGKMAPADLRQSFFALESQLSSGTAGAGGKEGTLSAEQADELRREIAYLKVLVYP